MAIQRINEGQSKDDKIEPTTYSLTLAEIFIHKNISNAIKTT